MYKSIEGDPSLAGRSWRGAGLVVTSSIKSGEFGGDVEHKIRRVDKKIGYVPRCWRACRGGRWVSEGAVLGRRHISWMMGQLISSIDVLEQCTGRRVEAMDASAINRQQIQPESILVLRRWIAVKGA